MLKIVLSFNSCVQVHILDSPQETPDRMIQARERKCKTLKICDLLFAPFPQVRCELRVLRQRVWFSIARPWFQILSATEIRDG